MKIHEVEHQTGLDRATIRFYESEGLIAPARSDNGYRQYSNNDIEVLLKIKLLRQLGIRLGEIKDLQQGSSDFSDILSKQAIYLDQDIQPNERAKFVCLQMQNENVQYATLNSPYYLGLMQKQETQQQEKS